MLAARILGTGSYLPTRRITTEELCANADLGRSAVQLQERTGIAARHWVSDGETTASMAIVALKNALENAGLVATDLDRIILANSTGGDVLIPATVNSVICGMGLDGRTDGFDLNNACTGFLSALDVASRCVATGYGTLAIVAVETLSRFLSPTNPRPYAVLADAAAAMIVGPAREGEGFIAAYFGNLGAELGSVAMSHPGWTEGAPLVQFGGSNDHIGQLAIHALEKASARVLTGTGLTVGDVDWVVPHQPNGAMLDKIAAHFAIAPERFVRRVDEVGSVGTVTIPLSFDALWRSNRVQPGDRILFMGVGAGVSYGALLYQVAG